MEPDALLNPRMLRQYLESLQRAGVSHLPNATVEQPAVEEAVAAPVQAPQGSTAPPPRAVAPTAAAPPPAAKPKVVAPEPPRQPVSPPATAPVPAAPISTLSADASLDERADALELLSQQVAVCMKCQDLAASRRQTVFGVGSPVARIMFIGEAPGADEDRLGEPFVGKAGQLMDKIIVASQLKREEIYICNILRCRPPGNRNPSPIEASNCREFLDGQIGIVQPEYIVCWGSVAAKNLLGVETSIGRMRGRFYEYGTAKVLCTYHPSYLLRNPSAKKQVWEDMKLLMQQFDVEL